jgi:hypothetical protein
VTVLAAARKVAAVMPSKALFDLRWIEKILPNPPLTEQADMEDMATQPQDLRCLVSSATIFVRP